MPDIYPDGHCNTSMGLSAWIVVFGAINLVLIQVTHSVIQSASKSALLGIRREESGSLPCHGIP